LKSDLSRPLSPFGYFLPREKEKRKTVFERVKELSVEEVLDKITVHYLFLIN